MFVRSPCVASSLEPKNLTHMTRVQAAAERRTKTVLAAKKMRGISRKLRVSAELRNEAVKASKMPSRVTTTPAFLVELSDLRRPQLIPSKLALGEVCKDFML